MSLCCGSPWRWAHHNICRAAVNLQRWFQEERRERSLKGEPGAEVEVDLRPGSLALCHPEEETCPENGDKRHFLSSVREITNCTSSRLKHTDARHLALCDSCRRRAADKSEEEEKAGWQTLPECEGLASQAAPLFVFRCRSNIASRVCVCVCREVGG